MFEKQNKPLLPKEKYYKRILNNFFWSLLIIMGSLLIGILGYHFIAKLSWIDSLLNSTMILTGMGPVNVMVDNASKVFASFYALFSGVAFLTTIAVMFAPMIHRFMHKFHLGEEE